MHTHAHTRTEKIQSISQAKHQQKCHNNAHMFVEDCYEQNSSVFNKKKQTNFTRTFASLHCASGLKPFFLSLSFFFPFFLLPSIACLLVLSWNTILNNRQTTQYTHVHTASLSFFLRLPKRRISNGDEVRKEKSVNNETKNKHHTHTQAVHMLWWTL